LLSTLMTVTQIGNLAQALNGDFNLVQKSVHLHCRSNALLGYDCWVCLANAFKLPARKIARTLTWLLN